MPGVELAAAYISLVPSAKGIGQKIATEIGPPLEAAGRDAWEKASSSFADSFRKRTSSLSAGFAKVGLAATAGLTVPILAVGKQLIDSASGVNEQLGKTRIVFGAYTKDIEALAATSARKLGQSREQVLAAAGTFGNLFVALKIGQKPAAEMSARLVTLASDLASFSNASPEDALAALQSGLVGETEPLRKFGINLNDATLQAEALRLGIGDGKTLTPATKAQAAYSLILEQSKIAQGNFALTAGDVANQQRILTAEFANAKATLGQALLPVFLQVAQVVSQLAQRFGALSPQIQKVILVVAGVLAIAGPLATAIGGLITVIGFVASPVGLIVVGIAALAAGLIYAYTHVESFRTLVNDVASGIAGFVVPRIQNLIDLFRVHIIPAVTEAAQIIGAALAPKLNELQAAFERNRPQIEAVVGFLGVFIDKTAEVYAKVAEFLLPILAKVAVFFGGQFVNGIVQAVDAVGLLIRGLEKVVEVGNSVGGFLSKIPGVGGGGNSFHIPGLAVGGFQPAGALAWTGERGPELTIGPPGGRFVIPAAASAALVRGGDLSGSARPSQQVAINVAAPIDAGVARQIEQGARVGSWILDRTGRR